MVNNIKEDKIQLGENKVKEIKLKVYLKKIYICDLLMQRYVCKSIIN